MARSPHAQSGNGASALKFSTYPFAALVQLKSDLERELQSRKAEELKGLRAKVAEAAHSLGVSIEEVLGARTRRKRVTAHARGKLPAKYRGPKGEEWSGKGPAPKWMKPLLVKGKTKADFLIK
jgi:DNA-binding protein H-NS